MMVEVIFHGVNNDEAVAGPFKQVATEVEPAGHGVFVTMMRDVVTRDLIASAVGSWWFYEGEPYKQAFIRAVIEETT
jgi:hypothetical protein